MKKLAILIGIMCVSSSSFAGDFMLKLHKNNAKKSQQACFKNDKWAGRNCNTAGLIWLKKLNNKAKALKWFRIGCKEKSYFRACTNYKKYGIDS